MLIKSKPASLILESTKMVLTENRKQDRKELVKKMVDSRIYDLVFDLILYTVPLYSTIDLKPLLILILAIYL